MSARPVLICDFDGTIMDIDTCVFLLEKFVKDDWKAFDLQYERGEISIEECMQKQLAMLSVPKHVMLRELEKVTVIRPNFENLIEYCKMKSVLFIIVSAGLDFVIRHFLELNGWEDLVKVKAAKTTFTDDGIKLTFPDLVDETSIDFKEDLVKYYKRQGYTVIYVGDGISDYNAVRNADYSFVIKRSKLADLCKRNRIPHREIIDFQEVVDTIKAIS